MRRAERMTQELLRRVPTALRRNVTEKALAWKLAQWAQELGADRLAFDPIVAFGTHTSRPHHQPTTRALQKGHLVQIDVGAVYRGYCADMSRVFFTAKPTAEQERAYRAVMEAKETAQAAIRAGVSTKELDQQARGVLRSYGMEAAFTHALGHGLGLEVHEGVTVSSHAPLRTLVPGEVITVEPGVYFPGKFGIRIEDMAVVE
jgi:Xaa-Pro aminopeptidase